MQRYPIMHLQIDKRVLFLRFLKALYGDCVQENSSYLILQTQIEIEIIHLINSSSVITCK